MPKRILYLGLDPQHYQTDGDIFHCPIIQIIPRPLSDPAVKQALKNFEQYSHVIITSKSTVGILKEYLPRLGINLHSWTMKSTLAVGQVTAKTLELYGIVPTKIAQEETAEGIIKELKQLPLKQANIFWPHSSKARLVIKNFLVSEEICHTTCAVYDPKPHLPSSLPSLETFQEIVFTSPSTVEAFLYFFKTFPAHAKLISIGPITAHFLEAIQKPCLPI